MHICLYRFVYLLSIYKRCSIFFLSMNVLILTQRSGVYPRRPLMSKIFLWTAYAALLYVPQRKISRIFPKINYIFKICCSCGVGCCVVIENYLRWSFRRFTLIEPTTLYRLWGECADAKLHPVDQFLTQIFFLKIVQSRPLFFIFLFSIELTSKRFIWIFADDWIRTADFWCGSNHSTNWATTFCPTQIFLERDLDHKS